MAPTQSVHEVQSKLSRYGDMVVKRKDCRECAGMLCNPAQCPGMKAFDSDQIGPWSLWHHDVNADLMVVGQDWGGSVNYKDQKGLDDADSTANRNLAELLKDVGFDAGYPGQDEDRAANGRLFLTNAVLCIKPGADNGDVPSTCFSRCGKVFLRPLIELIEPRVVVSVGLCAYTALVRAFSVKGAARTMGEALTLAGHRLNAKSFLVPVWHCGGTATASRPLAIQRADWSRVKKALD